MAEYVYTINGFSLTSTWKRSRYGGAQGETITTIGLTGDSTTKSIDLSNIVLGEGENIKRAMLTATLNRTGTTDYSETITVNGMQFSRGARKLDLSTITAGEVLDIRFYFCASGSAPDTPPFNATTSYSCTMWYSDVTLTITTGIGSAFDGQIGSLPEGSKILVEEENGAQGTYSIVHHGYGDSTLCLLWRDNCLPSSCAFNHNSDSFLADKDGALDKYLNETFYSALPNSTKQYIQPAIYPTLDKRLYGTVMELSRYVCTPSIRELTETSGGAEWHGMPLDYLETKDCDEVYWTRSVYTSSSGLAYRVNDSGTSYTYNRSYSTGVRPCFCVLEEQMVMPSDDGMSYVFSSKVASPGAVYLNGGITNLVGCQRDASAVLSWDVVMDTRLTGYEVWRCDRADGDYIFLGAVTATDDGNIPTELIVHTGDKGFSTLYYKVKAVTALDTDYLDSELSSDVRSMTTKRTNVHYYDGTRWLLADVNHYNGSVWDMLEGAQYYDGTQWIVPDDDN